MIYYSIYFPFILAAIFSINHKFNEKLKPTRYLAVIILTLFAGLQYGISDYWSYWEMYDNYTFEHINFPFFISYAHGGTGHEFGFTFLSTLFSFIGFPYATFFAFIVIFTVGLKLHFLKNYSPYFYLSLLIYISLILIKDMTQLRASLATSIIFFSALLIIYKKPFIYFLSILLASSFHVFALTALPLYWIARSKYLKKIIIIGIVASVIIYLSGGILTVIINNTVADPFSYLHYKLTGYIEGDKNISVNAFGLGNIFYLGIISYGIYMWKYTNENMLYKILLLYMAFGVSGYILAFNIGLISFRFLEMYVHFSLALIMPFYISISNNKMKILFWIIAIIYSFYFIIYQISFSGLVEYNNIFFLQKAGF